MVTSLFASFFIPYSKCSLLQHYPFKYTSFPLPPSHTLPKHLFSSMLFTTLSFNSSFQFHSSECATLLFALLFISILPTLNYKSNARNALILPILLYFHEPLVACTISNCQQNEVERME